MDGTLTVEVDDSLRERLEPKDWRAYLRLTALARRPPFSERRAAKAIAFVSLVIIALLIPVVVVPLVTMDLFRWDLAFLFAPLPVIAIWLSSSLEEPAARRRILQRRAEVVSRAAPAVPSQRERAGESGGRSYPMTGMYDPELNRQRGGHRMWKTISSQGYSSYDEWESNHPD